jgi:hypothetical protein
MYSTFPTKTKNSTVAWNCPWSEVLLQRLRERGSFLLYHGWNQIYQCGIIATKIMLVLCAFQPEVPTPYQFWGRCQVLLQNVSVHHCKIQGAKSNKFSTKQLILHLVGDSFFYLYKCRSIATTYSDKVKQHPSQIPPCRVWIKKQNFRQEGKKDTTVIRLKNYLEM